MIKFWESEKGLAASAYVLGVPALYIILTPYRRDRFLSFHAAQALVLWFFWLLFAVGLRVVFNLIWRFFYLWVLDPLAFWSTALLWGFIAYCGYRVYQGIDFEVPCVTKIALVLW